MGGNLVFPKGFGSTVKFKELQKDGKPVCGFDTETDAITAQPYLLTYSDETRNSHTAITTPNRLLDFLTTHRYRDTVNFFHNLSFDFEGMIKIFPKEVGLGCYGDGRSWISENGEIRDESDYDYRLSYIYKKAFHIKVKGDKKYSYFDSFQYFQMGLDAAAKKYLGVGKDKGFEGKYSSKNLFELNTTIEAEVERFTKHYLEEYAFYSPQKRDKVIREMQDFFFQFTNAKEYRERLLEYALVDAHRCKQLGEIIVKGINNFVNTRNFNSSASISEYYFRSHDVHIPKLTQDIFKKFMATYYGGRFEITRKGWVPNVSMFDIKSAYPYAMTELPILSKNPRTRSVWQPTESGLFGAYLINAKIPTDMYLSPLPVRNGLVKFPTGNFSDYWVDKLTLELLEEIGIKYHVIKGIEISDPNADFRLKPLVLELFNIKENKKNPEVVRQAAKIILNSLYGKFMQLNDDTILEEIEELNDLDEVGPQGLFNIGNKMFARIHNNDFNTGKMFAPQYGAFITAHTRNLIYRTSLKLGLENVVGIHTDSIMLDGNKFLEESSVIGGFELEVLKEINEDTGEVIRKIPMRNVDTMIQKCGMYEATVGNVKKIKARGVGRATTLMQDSFEVTRRFGLKQAIKRDYESMNIIRAKMIKNDLNSDRKRQWPHDITLKDIENKLTINSKTLNGDWTTNVNF